jgi:hypothetical protein
MSEHLMIPAELRLRAESEGGRATSIRSGYRSIVRFGEPDAEAWGAEITFGDRAEWLAPGGSASVELRFWALGEAPPVGTQFFLFEGDHLVGQGVTG